MKKAYIKLFSYTNIVPETAQYLQVKREGIGGISMEFLKNEAGITTNKLFGQLPIRQRENAIWRKTLEDMLDPTADMNEDEKKNYENKIYAKLESGKNLSSEELNYLRIHNPQMYQTAMRVKIKKEAVKHKLQNCKSKEEVNAVINEQIGGVSEKDPDKKYLIAGIEYVAKKFRETAAYKRLPDTAKQSDRKKIKPKSILLNDDIEKEDSDSTASDKNITPIIELLETLPVFDMKN